MVELCYINNSQSLFRKYAQLVTWFANNYRDYLTDIFPLPRKVALLLPNGFIEYEGGRQAQATFATRAVYSSKLYFSLLKIDIMLDRYPLSLEDLKTVLLMDLGLKSYGFEYPQVFLAETTFNPNANPETTSVDGGAERSGVSEAFGTLRGGAGVSAQDSSGGGGGFPRLTATATTDLWAFLSRAIYLFDTSALGAGASISAAIFSIYIDSGAAGLSQSLNVTSSNPASNTALVAGDYAIANFGSTDFSTDMTVADAVSPLNVYEDWALNATGIAAISLTGITKFAHRLTADIDNSAPTWGAGADVFITPQFADGTNKPKLTVTYTPAAGGEISYTFFM